MHSLIFHPDVQIEVKYSFEWYQEQYKGLGHEFIHELEESFESIRTMPTSWPKMGQYHRRFILSRFPFSVIYKVASLDTIHVVAVMHNHRKPGYWQERG